MDNPAARPSRADQRRATEARILAEARRLFAESGYDRTTIRAVATAAQVDPGLVMHYYGSKARLFARVIEAGSPPLLDGTAAEITEQLLDRLRRSLAEEPGDSMVALRSMLTHPEAADEVRAATRQVKDQISRSIPDEQADLRAATVSAVFIGLLLGRHLVRLDHLADADPDQIVDVLRPVLRTLMKAD